MSKRLRIGSPRSFLYWLALLCAVGVLFGPALRLQPSAWWKTGAFDGHRHVLGWRGVVRVEGDVSGTASTLATLSSWIGEPAPQPIEQGLSGRDAVRRFARSRNLGGAWRRDANEAVSLAGEAPFIAEVRQPSPRLLIVKRANAEHVYAADPLSGNVLYPTERFLRVWTGDTFRFASPSVFERGDL